MVRANRPWRLVPSLLPAIDGAAAGAAFGVFYSNIRELADAFSTLELSLAELQDRFALAEGKATLQRAGNRRAPPMSGPWPLGSNTAA